MKKLLETLKGRKFEVPPVWFMRQAGRYLPEYHELRSKAKSFLEICYNPRIASEITLQPIRRFGFDGAIIFSDILVIPDALGIKVEFVKNEGPKLEPIRSEKDILKLKLENIESHLNPVFENISLTKSKLDNDKTLIGFSGSPWTIASYMVEGCGPRKFDLVRSLAISNPAFFYKLINVLSEAIIIYILNQIKAGAEVIKLFDSWSGVLPESDYKKWVIEPNKKIIDFIKNLHPEVPIIIFPRGSGVLYEYLVKEIDKCEGIAIDQNLPKIWARDILQNKYNKVIQGNLDNILLRSGDDFSIKKEVLDILRCFSEKPFIFNLGHGILPDTPIKNVNMVLNIIREM